MDTSYCWKWSCWIFWRWELHKCTLHNPIAAVLESVLIRQGWTCRCYWTCCMISFSLDAKGPRSFTWTAQNICGPFWEQTTMYNIKIYWKRSSRNASIGCARILWDWKTLEGWKIYFLPCIQTLKPLFLLLCSIWRLVVANLQNLNFNPFGGVGIGVELEKCYERTTFIYPYLFEKVETHSFYFGGIEVDWLSWDQR